jgi:hypothetical protein
LFQPAKKGLRFQILESRDLRPREHRRMHADASRDRAILKHAIRCDGGRRDVGSARSDLRSGRGAYLRDATDPRSWSASPHPVHPPFPIAPTSSTVVTAITAAITRIIREAGSQIVCKHIDSWTDTIIGLVALALGAPEGELDAILIAAALGTARKYIRDRIRGACGVAA